MYLLLACTWTSLWWIVCAVDGWHKWLLMRGKFVLLLVQFIVDGYYSWLLLVCIFSCCWHNWWLSMLQLIVDCWNSWLLMVGKVSWRWFVQLYDDFWYSWLFTVHDSSSFYCLLIPLIIEKWYDKLYMAGKVEWWWLMQLTVRKVDCWNSWLFDDWFG